MELFGLKFLLLGDLKAPYSFGLLLAMQYILLPPLLLLLILPPGNIFTEEKAVLVAELADIGGASILLSTSFNLS